MDKMKSFGSLSLGSRLKRLSDRLIQNVVEIYQAQGINLSPSYFPLFNLIHHQGPQSVTEAADQLGVSHPAISKIAQKMIKEGWLIKTADPCDTRRNLLSFSLQSEELLQKIKPIWLHIKEYLDQLMAKQNHSLLVALDEFEQVIDRQGFVQPVLSNIKQAIQRQELEIISWDSNLREHFKRLNMQWLDQYFDGELTDLDIEALNNPEGYYLSRGGAIWFARYQGNIVGCVSLARHRSDLFEISKMAVVDGLQGLGIGSQLMIAALEKARQYGATDVYLETAACLTRGVKFYQRFGFQIQPHPLGKSIYPRADLYMTLTL